MADLAISQLFFTLISYAQPVITAGPLLKEITSFQSVACWPQPSFIMKQASSYDSRSVAVDQPGWFANDLEMQSWEGETIDAAATVYWYGAPGSESR